MKWRDEINAKDEHGAPTALAIALAMFQEEGCDCSDGHGPCPGCLYERALHELWGQRNEARAKLAEVRQELAATLECYCGTCFACRVADVLGAP